MKNYSLVEKKSWI